jgi:hypothetical protein
MPVETVVRVVDCPAASSAAGFFFGGRDLAVNRIEKKTLSFVFWFQDRPESI